MSLLRKHPFEGQSGASLLAEVGKRFADKDSWMHFLEGITLLALKDALCVVDDVVSDEVSNADAGLHAHARAIALIAMLKMGAPQNAIQEPSPAPEVPRASEAGKDGPESPSGMGASNGKRKATGAKTKAGKS